jgi:thiol-disulfide isomerase/thioredoxin
MNRQVLAIVAVAVVASAAGWWIGRHLRAPHGPVATAAAPAVETLTSVPDLSLPTVDGTVRRLGEWRGRPVLINYWATWCPPCVAEMPVLDAFAAEQGDAGVAVVGIALDEPGAVRGFLQRVPVAYPNLIEEPGPQDSSMQLGNRRAVLPYSVLADADGRVLATHAGSLDEAGLRRFVEGALGR